MPLTVKTLISFQRIRALAGGASTGRSMTSGALKEDDSRMIFRVSAVKR